jgi:hypothetical protein
MDTTTPAVSPLRQRKSEDMRLRAGARRRECVSKPAPQQQTAEHRCLQGVGAGLQSGGVLPAGLRGGFVALWTGLDAASGRPDELQERACGGRWPLRCRSRWWGGYAAPSGGSTAALNATCFLLVAGAIAEHLRPATKRARGVILSPAHPWSAPAHGIQR